MLNKYKDNIKTSDTWREDMIVKHAYLVKHISASFARRLPSTVQFDELVSAGSLGLIDAVDKFDRDKYVSLNAYAKYRIKGAILDELRSMDPYSRSMRKKIQNISKAVHKVENANGGHASDSKVAEELGVDLKDYFDMLTEIHGATVLSLDAFIKTKNYDNFSNTTFQIGLKGKDNPAESFDIEEIKVVLANGIKKLTEKEQKVVSLYYYEEFTLKEIGEILSLTESRICQIHTALLIKLKLKISSYFSEKGF
ncbi:MAG: RNA polymerase subunit sigma-28 [Desulfobacteraceae bacterium 4572_130]|nr:MAG: RNA polymerase subunit sigma-28 [Desulfobacteraceae bacterium 4572_130]